MGSRHLVDPELIPALELFPPLTLSTEGLPKLRDAMSAALNLSAPNEYPSVRIEAAQFPGPRGAPPVSALIYRPGHAPVAAGIVLHIHGGGYIVGSARMAEAENLRICAELGCAVVSVDYRLAPETPHPGGLEDCYSVLKSLYSQSAVIEGDRSRIAISGDSAGGGLAAALALLARDRGEVPIAFQHLVYPMLDDRTCVKSNPSPFVGEFVWTPEHNRFGWSALLQMPPGSETVSEYAAAARAKNLAGLPATFIGVGALDLFVDENIAYATRLVNAGVPTELHVYPGAFHGFRRAMSATVAKAAARDSLAALRRAVA